MMMHMHEQARRHTADQADDASAGTAFDHDEGENTAHALIRDADEAVRACNEAFSLELDNVARKTAPRLGTASVAIYKAVCAFDANNSGAAFIAERKVKVHGNTTNPYYGYVLGFSNYTHPLLRNKLCKFAAAVGLARHENVPPDDFAAWLKNHPVEQACKEYRRVMREQSNSRHDKATRRIKELLVDPAKEPNKAPLRGATPLTVGHVGAKVFVVECVADGRGDFHVLGVMPHDAEAVMHIVEAAAATP